MNWKEAQKKLIRSDIRTRYYYYRDLPFQLRRLWWKIKKIRGRHD